MDWVALTLVGVFLIEFIVIVVLLVILSDRKPIQPASKTSRRDAVEEIEREAAAIASVGRKLKR